jgi:hypothetical protein
MSYEIEYYRGRILPMQYYRYRLVTGVQGLEFVDVGGFRGSLVVFDATSDMKIEYLEGGHDYVSLQTVSVAIAGLLSPWLAQF